MGQRPQASTTNPSSPTTHTLPSRRAVLQAAGAAGVALPFMASGTPAYGVPMRLAARASDNVVNSYGVVIHSHWAHSVYGDDDRVRRWLDDLGVRHVRTRLGDRDSMMEIFSALHRSNIKVNGVCGEMGDNSDTAMSIMSTVERHFRHPERVFSAFENVNEPNNDGRAWVEETRRRARELKAARDHFGFKVPILAPSLAEVTSGGVEGGDTLGQAKVLGDLHHLVDRGNMHVYSRALPPHRAIKQFVRPARIVAGRKPIICTEGGYFTALDYQGSSFPVSPEVAAAYGPQSLFEHMNHGVRRFFRYELLDEPSGTSWDREASLGLLRTGDRWRPKPEYRTLRRMLHMFRDRGPAFEPDPLNVAFRNAPGGLRHAVFQKRDGTHLLALWLGREIWDPPGRRLKVRHLDATMGTVGLRLDRPRPVTVSRFVGEPNDRGRTDSVRIPLKPGVTVVELGPA